MRTSLFSILIMALCCAAWAYAQEPADAPEPPSWVAKVNAAIADKTGLTLTAEETQAMAESYATALNAQAADIALSETTCYVLSRDGTVLASKAIP